jgi:hypothetical protein
MNYRVLILRFLGLPFVVAAGLAASATDATAQLIVTPNIEELCRLAPRVTNRRTLIYVDLASIGKGKTDWGLSILNRLELGAREPLTILGVNPTNFEIKEVFDACYPVLTPSEIEETRAARGIWEKLVKLDPADQQRENLQTFDARLRNSLNRLNGDADKFRVGNRRNILGAIAFDKNRFAERNAFYRVIIYTDGSIIDSGLDSNAPESQYVASLKEKYPTSRALTSRSSAFLELTML